MITKLFRAQEDLEVSQNCLTPCTPPHLPIKTQDLARGDKVNEARVPRILSDTTNTKMSKVYTENCIVCLFHQRRIAPLHP